MAETNYEVAKSVAEIIAAGAHAYDAIPSAERFYSHLPKNQAEQMTIETVILAGAITLTEKIKSVSGDVLTKKEVLGTYIRAVYENFHIPQKDAKKIVTAGIEHYLLLNALVEKGNR